MKKILLLALLLSANAGAAITYIGAGTAVDGADGANLSPTLHASTTAGDLIVCSAGQKNGTALPTATGYDVLNSRNTRGATVMLGRIATGSDTPSIVYTDKTAGRGTIAQCATFRGTLSTISGIVSASSATDNVAQQNMATPALAPVVDNTVAIVMAFKENDWNGDNIAALATMTEIGQPERTSNQQVGIVWDYVIQTTRADIAASSFASSSGGSAEAMSLAVSLLPDTSGRQNVTLTSVNADSWCADFNVLATPDIATGDQVQIDRVTSPGGYPWAQDVDCNARFTGTSARQSVTYQVFDTSAGALMASGPGTLWINNQAPVALFDSYDTVLAEDAAMTTVDLRTLFTDAESDTLTVTSSDTGTGTGADKRPAGTTISGSSWSGTPTTAGTGSFTLTATDITGATTTLLVTWEVAAPLSFSAIDSEATTTGYTLTLTPNTDMQVCVVALTVGSTAPLGAQIIAGTDGLGGAAAVHVCSSAVSGQTFSLTISGRTIPKADVYAVGYVNPSYTSVVSQPNLLKLPPAGRRYTEVVLP